MCIFARVYHVTVKMRLLFFLFALISLQTVLGQVKDSTQTVKVFIDCPGCDKNYFRSNLPYATLVRDRYVADCHIQFFSQRTGSGGSKYEFHFIGLNKYSSIVDTLHFSVPNNTTSHELRQAQLHYLKIGLVSFWIKNGTTDHIAVMLQDDGIEEEKPKDKWKNWVFSINTSVYTDGQASYASFSNNNSVSAERVREQDRIDFGGWYNYQRKKYVLTDPDTVVYNIQKSNAVDLTYTRALSDNLSAGAFTNAGSSIYNNYDFYGTLKGALEYNIYDYAESNNKQIRLGYKIGPRFNDYIDSTVYNQIEELLWQQTFSTDMKFKKPWGNISYSVSWNNYMHDLQLNSLNNWVSLNIRVFKGLSWRMSGSFRIIKDQVNLERGEASYEEVLLQQTQLATAYNYWLSTGLSFTFGSIYNDVVNPRFGY